MLSQVLLVSLEYPQDISGKIESAILHRVYFTSIVDKLNSLSKYIMPNSPRSEDACLLPGKHGLLGNWR